jgi:hypothetical protein
MVSYDASTVVYGTFTEWSRSGTVFWVFWYDLVGTCTRGPCALFAPVLPSRTEALTGLGLSLDYGCDNGLEVGLTAWARYGDAVRSLRFRVSSLWKRIFFLACEQAGFTQRLRYGKG